MLGAGEKEVRVGAWSDSAARRWIVVRGALGVLVLGEGRPERDEVVEAPLDI